MSEVGTVSWHGGLTYPVGSAPTPVRVRIEVNGRPPAGVGGLCGVWKTHVCLQKPVWWWSERQEKVVSSDAVSFSVPASFLDGDIHLY